MILILLALLFFVFFFFFRNFLWQLFVISNLKQSNWLNCLELCSDFFWYSDCISPRKLRGKREIFLVGRERKRIWKYLTIFFWSKLSCNTGEKSEYMIINIDVCVCVCVHTCSVASVMSNSLWLYELYFARLLCPWDSPGKNTGVVCHAFLQGIFLTQGLNPHLLYLLHCRWVLYPTEPPEKPNTNIYLYKYVLFIIQLLLNYVYYSTAKINIKNN